MKRFLSLLLTFLLLLCVCSCSGQDPHEAQTNTKTMPLTTETETAALTDIVTTEAVPEETATEPLTTEAETEPSQTDTAEAQPQIVIGSVVYDDTVPQNEIATDIHSERDVVECKYYDVGSFWRDVTFKTVRGSVAVKMKQFLSACTETGQSAAALTDSEDTYIDTDSHNLPCKNDTDWYEVDGVIYRYDKAEKTLARVNGHLGAGEYLQFDEQVLDEIKRDIGYWPYDYFVGTYQNGVLTLNHKSRAETAASIEITDIQIDQIDGTDNSVTLAVTAEQDMTLTIRLDTQFSDDHLLDGYNQSVTLQGGTTQTVVLPFLGSADHRYGLDIRADSTVIRMTIIPQ